MIQWFMDIYSGVATAIQGFWITGKHFFRSATTVEYPEVNVESLLPERYRGILQVDIDICISCHLCETSCPIACIVIEDVKGEKSFVESKITGKPTPKLKYPTRFDIDIAKCMYCGLCVEPCPTGAIHHTRRFEGTVQSVPSLVYAYVGEHHCRQAETQQQKFNESRSKKDPS